MGAKSLNNKDGQFWNGTRWKPSHTNTSPVDKNLIQTHFDGLNGGNNKSYGDIFGNRFLDQRSRIEFHYPGKWSDGESDIITFIPFYENPEIKESQTANYVEYNPIGRGGSLFAYTGTKSRKFKVSLTFTLPHLAMHSMGIERFMRVFVGASDNAKRNLFTKRFKKNAKGVGDAPHSLAAAVASTYRQMAAPPAPPLAVSLVKLGVKALSSLFSGSSNIVPASLAAAAASPILPASHIEMDKVIDTLLFFIAILRTSVVNKVTDPMQGPPLLRLNFGTLYQSVPCICKNYNLSWEEKAGYDLATLTPRRLKIDLTLDEVRVGNGMEYEAGVFSQRDGLTGWESAINDPYTTDPINLGGAFGESGAT
jgi:hypothetical protein